MNWGWITTFSQCMAASAVLALTGAAPVHAAIGDKLDRTRLVPTFSEEFDGPKLDLYQARTHPKGRWKPCYWFGWQPNGECVDTSSRQVGETDPTIASDPAYNGVNPFKLGGGILGLEIRPDLRPADPKNGGKQYTVGLLTTEPSFSQLYGYFEARITLPGVRGIWPAFWMLAKDRGTGAQQELDIMENLGVSPTRVLLTAHWKDGSPQSSTWTNVSTTTPHIYGLLWTKRELVWYIDGAEVNRKPNRDLNEPMYMIISMGVGGWPGSNNLPEDKIRIDGATMAVDYVRAYKLN